MPKIDWLWLLAGVAIAIVVHKVATHPKSPVSGLIGSKFS